MRAENIPGASRKDIPGGDRYHFRKALFKMLEQRENAAEKRGILVLSEDPLADECDLKQLEAAEGAGWVRSGKSTSWQAASSSRLSRATASSRRRKSRARVIEYAPESNQAAEYDALAARVEDNAEFCIPTPLSQERLEQLLIEYGM